MIFISHIFFNLINLKKKIKKIQFINILNLKNLIKNIYNRFLIFKLLLQSNHLIKGILK